MVKRMKWMGGGDLVVSSSGHDFLFEVKEINGCFIDAGQLWQWLSLVVPEELQWVHVIHLRAGAPIKRVQTLDARLELKVLQPEKKKKKKKKIKEIKFNEKSKKIIENLMKIQWKLTPASHWHLQHQHNIFERSLPSPACRLSHPNTMKERTPHILVHWEWWLPIVRWYDLAYACLLCLWSDALNVFKRVQELLLSGTEDRRCLKTVQVHWGINMNTTRHARKKKEEEEKSERRRKKKEEVKWRNERSERRKEGKNQ